MKAYVIVNVDVHDKDRYPEYVKMAPDASDAEEIRQTALGLRRSMAKLN